MVIYNFPSDRTVSSLCSSLRLSLASIPLFHPAPLYPPLPSTKETTTIKENERKRLRYAISNSFILIPSLSHSPPALSTTTTATTATPTTSATTTSTSTATATTFERAA